MKMLTCILLLLVTYLTGCDGNPRYTGGVASEEMYEPQMESAYSSRATSENTQYGSKASSSSGGYGGGGEASTEVPPGRFTQAAGADPEAATKRKLIYTTEMSIVVEDLDAALASLTKILNGSNGFVASNQLSSAVQNRRVGEWVIRVPVDDYGNALDQLRKLGQVTQIAEATDDVTEKYIDIEARLANSKRLEERIVDLLEDRSGKLADILEIERELARVRETIERIEGQLRYLSNQTSLATITIELREQKDYVPPEPISFASQSKASWNNSLQNVGTFFANAATQVVSFVPWLAVWVPGLLAVVLGGKLMKRLVFGNRRS